jgi:hypothetical protein
VVAERDHVCSGGEQLLGETRRNAHAVGGVLAVQDTKRHVVPVAQLRQEVLDCPAPWPADDVGDEEDVQGQRPSKLM